MDLEVLKRTCLKNDVWRDRPWQLYVNDEQLFQLDPDTNLPLCNPRIRKLKIEEVSQLSQLTDKLIIYEARIIKNDLLNHSIGKKNEYALSFNLGITKQIYQLIEIKESRIQGLAWKLLLAR